MKSSFIKLCYFAKYFWLLSYFSKKLHKIILAVTPFYILPFYTLPIKDKNLNLLRPSTYRISTFFTVPCISEATKCSTHKSRNFSYFYTYKLIPTKQYINNKNPHFFFNQQQNPRFFIKKKNKNFNQKTKRKKKRNLRFPISFSILFLLGDGRIILQNISQSKTHKNKKINQIKSTEREGDYGNCTCS